MIDQMKQLASNLVRQNDLLVTSVISKFLGRSNWTLAEVQKRGQFMCYPDGVRVFLFDGVGLIEFREVTSNCHDRMLSMQQQYRILDH